MSRSSSTAIKPSYYSNFEVSSQVETSFPSERGLEQRLAKPRREESGRKAEAETSLARQKSDVARQAYLQVTLKIRITEENQRQIFTQVRIEEAVYDKRYCGPSLQV